MHLKVASDSRTMTHLLKDGLQMLFSIGLQQPFLFRIRYSMDALRLDNSITQKKKLLINIGTL